MAKKVLYQYTVTTDGEKSYLQAKGFNPPICKVEGDADGNPQLAAKLLRKLAAWAVKQVELIEDLEIEENQAEYMAYIDKQDKKGKILPF